MLPNVAKYPRSVSERNSAIRNSVIGWVNRPHPWIINEYAVAIPPANPIASCHVIVAPRRHVASFYDLDVQEQRVIWDMLHDLRKRITEALAVQGFDAGFVDVPAGKEPAHTHVHLVPRVAGETVQLRSEAEWVDLT